MGPLNSFLGQRGGQNLSKHSNARGVARRGMMLQLRFDWYISFQYNGIPIFQASKGNENWLKKSDSRRIAFY